MNGQDTDILSKLAKLPWWQNLMRMMGRGEQQAPAGAVPGQPQQPPIQRPQQPMMPQQPLGFPQSDIPYRVEQLVAQGVPRQQAEVMALQEAMAARKQELSGLPSSIPQRMRAGTEYLKQIK